MSVSNLIAPILGFISGNYIYQFMQDTPDWSVANDRAFFQLGMAAIIIIYIKLQ